MPSQREMADHHDRSLGMTFFIPEAPSLSLNNFLGTLKNQITFVSHYKTKASIHVF